MSNAIESADAIMSSERAVRIAHLVSHPIQYFAPLYRELARRPQIDLTVYFYSDASVRGYHDREFGRTVRWDVPLLDGYHSEFAAAAPSTGIEPGLRGGIHWDVVRSVVSGRYDVVWAHGYAYPTTWLTLMSARARRKQVAIREEQTLLHPRPAAIRLLKELALHPLFSAAWGFYIGEANRRYLRRYGVPERRLVPARYCVDNDALQNAAQDLAPHRSALRRDLGIGDDRPVILFVGKLIEKKQPLRLLDAYAPLEEDAWLVFVGDGPLRTELERQIAERGLERVRLTGFLNQTEIPRAYVAADVFTLPSAFDETWGLVVNDALNFSLPVVVTDKVGCAEDLVRHESNGFVVRHDDTTSLQRALAALVRDPELRRRFGARGRELVETYSVAACADGIVRGCLAAVGRLA